MRRLWLDTMLKIAEPVIENLAKEKLHSEIPADFHSHRSDFILLEAFGRTATGIAPWLENKELTGEEARLQSRYRSLIKKCIINAINPDSPDYMNFCSHGGQPLVDAAFLAHAVVRAPETMYFSLDDKTRKSFAECLKKSRSIKAADCNWLFFSAMIETALYVMGEDYSLLPVDHAINRFKKWYVGDGTYSDGEFFHWDYYNSLVIHPMQLDILKTLSEVREDYRENYNTCLKHALRHAEILERLINPDGTYAVIGRSSSYRFGVFHLLSHMALQESLPETLDYGQVRCALSAVIGKVSENGEMFDSKGFLTPGVYGYQPSMAEEYINVGSLYLCLAVFLPLGLSPEHPFWTSEDKLWSSAEIWSGQDVNRDKASD